MALRVIGGTWRGRNLRTVRGVGTRPLLSQVREALFNILGGWVEDKEVWDLFAGTGASGIEALSRGARRVVFVEKSNQALSVLRGNLEQLGPDAKRRSHVLKADAWGPPPMRLAGEEDEVPPDLVFFDPPYAAVAEDPVKAAYRARQIVDRLAPGGILAFHFLEGQLDRDDFDRDLNVELRRWGSSAMALIEAGGPASAGLVRDRGDQEDPDQEGHDGADDDADHGDVDEADEADELDAAGASAEGADEF